MRLGREHVKWGKNKDIYWMSSLFLVYRILRSRSEGIIVGQNLGPRLQKWKWKLQKSKEERTEMGWSSEDNKGNDKEPWTHRQRGIFIHQTARVNTHYCKLQTQTKIVKY